ncbi:hypothetical protein TCAL_06143 [Tigriopus californicus]|uniref:Peptidase S1 domain-containing protein n=1 Tax=Tigriopus californicus TaxID=6832 RepID=A0A553NXA8_TIGCA|nr:ankyrin repeat and KH domain-containing protein 1-like [Tigriopus californicus]TRY70058.1 hypothetical protein TCAL_06143 [Tigriopus californicus]|eukprot:TCALIF_06143-PA protein Name:"Similar to ANK1 Ankyrin-1 (Homo sapiens)" AED:0.28 eAED:0.28 QI:0/0/0/0.14/1/1/7/0/668
MRTLHILILVCALLDGKWTFGQQDELSCGISKPVEYLNIVGIRSFSDVVSRVAGTSETESVRPRTYPWLVSAGFLDNDGLWNHQCGGSIISNKHILTAAHCTMGPGNMVLRFGDTRLRDANDDQAVFTRSIYRTHVHPKYQRDKNEAYYDVAIWEIKPGIQFNSFVRPICIPNEAKLNVDQHSMQQMHLAGWGLSGRSAAGSQNMLRQVFLTIYAQRLCQTLYEQADESDTNIMNAISNLIPNGFQSNIVCAGGAITGNYGSCKGDSGSPLFQFSQSRLKFIQQGIVSGGIGSCGDPKYPSIYVRLEDPEILKFIKSTIKDNLVHGKSIPKTPVKPPKPAQPSNSKVALDPKGQSAMERDMVLTASKAINNGRKVDQQDRNGRSLLWKTAEMGVFPAARILVENRADLNLADKQGITPLHVASEKGFTSLVNLLVNFNASVNVTDNRGMSPLSYAAQSGNALVANALVSSGAMLSHQDIDGNTPLHHAIMAGHNELAAYFLSLGFNASIRNKEGLYPVHLAAQYSSPEVVRQMRSLGVDTNQLVGNGWCPLSLASIYGNREVVEYLVEEASADVAAVDNFGQTPLLAAACSGYDDIVAFLVKKDRAQVNRRDAFEQTPLHLAAKFGRKEVVELLLKNGANKQARTSQGQNPRDLAIQFGHFDLDQLLS